MEIKQFVQVSCIALGIISTSTAQAELHARLSGEAYYDDVLDVTWSKNPNPTRDGLTISVAETYLVGFEISGINGWRLPNMDVNNDGIVVDCAIASEEECRDNELGYMYYHNCVSASREFAFCRSSNTFRLPHWSSTRDPSLGAPILSVIFSFSDGSNSGTLGGARNLTWPMQDGDVDAAIGLIISPPPSGTYVTSQSFDLVYILNVPDHTITYVKTTFDGVNIDAILDDCAQYGRASSNGITGRCAGVLGADLGVGTHTLEVYVDLTDGLSLQESVTWEIIENHEDQ